MTYDKNAEALMVNQIYLLELSCLGDMIKNGSVPDKTGGEGLTYLCVYLHMHVYHTHPELQLA